MPQKEYSPAKELQELLMNLLPGPACLCSRSKKGTAIKTIQHLDGRPVR